jgi:hypothetical protein
VFGLILVRKHSFGSFHGFSSVSRRKFLGSNSYLGGGGDDIIFSIYLILPAALDLGVHSASYRNEYYQKHKNNVSGE